MNENIMILTHNFFKNNNTNIYMRNEIWQM